MRKMNILKGISMLTILIATVIAFIVCSRINPVKAIGRCEKIFDISIYLGLIILVLINVYIIKKQKNKLKIDNFCLDIALAIINYVCAMVAVNICYYFIDKKHSLAVLLSDRRVRTYLLFNADVNIWGVISPLVKCVLLIVIISLFVQIDVKSKKILSENKLLWVFTLLFLAGMGYDSYVAYGQADDEMTSYSISLDSSFAKDEKVCVGQEISIEDIDEIISQSDADEVSIAYVNGGHNVKRPETEEESSSVIEMNDDGVINAIGEGKAAVVLITYKYNKDNTCKCIYYYFGDYIVTK